MLLLTEDAVIVCTHELGKIGIDPHQDWVTIDARRVLVATDPEGRPISGCPNIGISIKPCQRTLRVEVGYSDWVRIDGRQICLDTIKGKTDGTPPGLTHYIVRRPGQEFVEETA